MINTQIDHEYVNSVIEEYIKELNGPETLRNQPSQPGNIFHCPIIIRGEKGNSWKDADEDLNTDFANRIKDGQVKGIRHKSKVIVGYVATKRSMNNKDLKEVLKPIIDASVLDLKEKLSTTYDKVPYVGEYFLTFQKNDQGNYLSDSAYYAGYELTLLSNCNINPPSTIDVRTFDMQVAQTLWNIRL